MDSRRSSRLSHPKKQTYYGEKITVEDSPEFKLRSPMRRQPTRTASTTAIGKNYSEVSETPIGSLSKSNSPNKHSTPKPQVSAFLRKSMRANANGNKSSTGDIGDNAENDKENVPESADSESEASASMSEPEMDVDSMDSDFDEAKNNKNKNIVAASTTTTPKASSSGIPERRKSSRVIPPKTTTSTPKATRTSRKRSKTKDKANCSDSDSEYYSANGDDGDRDSGDSELTTEVESDGDGSDDEGTSRLKKFKKSVWKSNIRNDGDGESTSKIILKITKQAENRDQTMEDIEILPDEAFNWEHYLTAGNRMKFKSIKSQAAVDNDARKGKGRGGQAKKPRKGTRGVGGERICNLPERIISNFSVTKEAARAASASSSSLATCHSDKHETEKQKLLEKYQSDFLRWIFLMGDGFSVMLHGFGSKVPVFEEFKSFIGGNAITVTVNGLFARKINPKKLLVDFCSKLLTVDEDEEEEPEDQDRISVTGTNLDAMSEEVALQLQIRSHRIVYFFVMNFDALAINQPGLLTVLNNLAKVEWIHILASVDSINGLLGVNQSQVTQFNFYWINCTTFQPYQSEFNSIPDIFGESKHSTGGEHALQFVLKSLTGNAKKAFSILASLQLAKLKNAGRGRRNKEFAGVEFGELARKCKEGFVAHSDAALRTLLVEFIDHKLVSHQGKNNSVGNLLTIELDMEALEKVVNDGIL